MQVNKTLIYIICEEYSCEHFYFRHFSSKYNGIRLYFYPLFVKDDFTGETSDYELFRKKLDFVTRKLDIESKDQVWILINTEDGFNQEKIMEVTDVIEGQKDYLYAICNPSFEVWLKAIDKDLGCEGIKDSKEIIKNKAKIEKAIRKMKKLNCENIGDGLSIPGYNTSTLSDLMSSLLKIDWE